MSFWGASIYDRIMATTEAACLNDWRRGLLTAVSGEVLEIGAGTGANLELFPDTLTRLVLSEPDAGMRRQLEQRLSKSNRTDVSITSNSAEGIDAVDQSFDYVVASLVCCSVRDLDAALLEIRRVLRPAGKFVFMEHVAAVSGSRRRRWQNGLTPLWKKLAGNCHLNRETELAIESAGFEIISITRESMRTAMPLVRPTIRGVAIKG